MEETKVTAVDGKVEDGRWRLRFELESGAAREFVVSQFGIESIAMAVGQPLSALRLDAPARPY